MWSNLFDFTSNLYRLVGCDLKKTDWEVLASALGSNRSHLPELDLSGTKLDDSSMKLISAVLKSPRCGLQTVRSDSFTTIIYISLVLLYIV